MKQGQSDVKSKGKVVGTANYNIYDTLQEAVETITEVACLELINTQTKTNSLNAVREGATERVGKKMLTAKALAAITPEEWGQLAGDAARIQQAIDAKIVELEEELKAAADAEATQA